MANRPSPAAAARAALATAANMTRGLEHALLTAVNETGGKHDGRRQRWEKHKQDRRTELTDKAIAAIRENGAMTGMDDIAAHVGVSKTVLYRYFVDKSDLGNAVTGRFFDTTLLPRLAEAITDDTDEYTLTRTVISVYVRAIDAEPALYRFAQASSPTSSVGSVEFEQLVAQLLTAVISMRMVERDGDISGAAVWSHTLVGGVQRAVDWWMNDDNIPVDDLIDYLTMMVWSAVVGIAAVNGSRDEFMAAPPVLPEPSDPPAPHTDISQPDPAQTSAPDPGAPETDTQEKDGT
ncbi:MAG: TetR/AcrR family transcriptional regulator [Gordonia sp. (in: high G+C Gram-positive bacteria)]